MRSYRSPLARSARTSCTSVVRPSASTIRREIPSALPRLAASARTPPRRHRGEQGARGVRCSGTTAAGPPQECLRRRSATTSRHSCLRWTSAAVTGCTPPSSPPAWAAVRMRLAPGMRSRSSACSRFAVRVRSPVNSSRRCESCRSTTLSSSARTGCSRRWCWGDRGDRGRGQGVGLTGMPGI
jgi:hypothetical protein